MLSPQVVQVKKMASMSYLPFRGLSAWFSCSVNPKVIKNWGEISTMQ